MVFQAGCINAGQSLSDIQERDDVSHLIHINQNKGQWYHTWEDMLKCFQLNRESEEAKAQIRYATGTLSKRGGMAKSEHDQVAAELEYKKARAHSSL